MTFCGVLLRVFGVTISAVSGWKRALVAEHVTVHPCAHFAVNYLLVLIKLFWGNL